MERSGERASRGRESAQGARYGMCDANCFWLVRRSTRQANRVLLERNFSTGPVSQTVKSPTATTVYQTFPW